MPGFVRRERKHKRIARQRPAHYGEDSRDSNASELPSVKDSRTEKKQRLQAELRGQDVKMSSKKRKRLDKYIETKLRKEENLELLRKLEQQKVDTSLLQSSRTLGRGQESRRERLSRALLERSAGINDGEGVLFEPRRDVEDSEDEEESLQEHDQVTVAETEPQRVEDSTFGFGSGLKRPLETDESGQPIIKKRKRRKTEKQRVGTNEKDKSFLEGADEPKLDEDVSSDEEWNGFDSEASATAETSDSEADSISEIDASSDEDELHSEASPQTSDTEKPARVSAFKAWAVSQRNAALDFTPSTVITHNAALKLNFTPRAPSPDPLLSEIQSNTRPGLRPVSAITIPRSDDIQAARLELPVVQEEQKIMEAIHNNPVVVVCGATGSGKTTQVPQMLFENGYGSHIGSKHNQPGTVTQPEDGQSKESLGMIGITQPRRVAATSVADRVAHELGPDYKNRVAHQVRFDANVSRDTAMKFMTDGILLREIQEDFTLSKYSAIVIDEAHERSVNTDILIGMLSRIVVLRAELAEEEPKKHYPLKLIIMSATLRVQDFLANASLFRKGVPPTVEAEGRQYPVTVHFSRRTARDYVDEIVEKVARGHRKLPPGGMLVFLTGQQEIHTVSKQLQERLGSVAARTTGRPHNSYGDGHPEVDDYEDFQPNRTSDGYVEGDDGMWDEDSDTDIKVDDGEDDKEFVVDDDRPQMRSKGVLKPHIMPLYAALPASQQQKVFQPPPENHRAIILATNVAETSLTIPGVRYVFDCGRSKEKRYDPSTGVQTFEVGFISKASASQRTGRAGRTGPGHCYRLYSSAVYERYFEEHTVPEILRTPLESTVLQLKAMDIENVINFPFPTSPERIQLVLAEQLLRNLGAISEKAGTITEIGRELIKYPVNPRFGKMLFLAQRNGVVAHAVAVVAGLAVGDLFIPEVQSNVTEYDAVSQSDDDIEQNAQTRDAAARHQAYTRARAMLSRWDDQSDVMTLLTAIAVHADSQSKAGGAGKFCSEFFVREKGMQEVQQLRQQLLSIVGAPSQRSGHANGDSGPGSAAISLPSEKERAMLKQIVAAGFIDQVAIRADLLKAETVEFGRKPRRAVEVAYRTLVPSDDPVDRAAATPVEREIQRSVFVHPSSVLARLAVKEMPPYVVYSHLSRAPPSAIGTSDGAKAPKVPKTRMHPLTTLGPKALAALAEGTALLDTGKPIGKTEDLPRGPGGEERRRCWVGVSLLKPNGAAGDAWPLGAWKVIQTRGARDWEIEKVVAR